MQRQTSTCGQLALIPFRHGQMLACFLCLPFCCRLSTSCVLLLPGLQMLDLLRDPSQLSLEVAVLPCLQMLQVLRG